MDSSRSVSSRLVNKPVPWNTGLDQRADTACFLAGQLAVIATEAIMTQAAPVPVRDMPGALEFSKTVSESDVYLFAGITGDYSPVHIDAEYAARQPVGERVAHGILLLGLMSAAASQWARREGLDILSYGYDGVRFIKPVRFGDTITVAYAKDREDASGRKYFSRVEAHNQRGELVGVAQHILWITGTGGGGVVEARRGEA
jgi:acyl dehydratase